MLETPHVALGAAIATKIPNPFIAVPLAFASHFLLERIPHWNPHLNTEMKKYGRLTRSTTVLIAVDATVSLLLGTFIAYKQLPDSTMFLNVMLCSFAAVLPDVLEAPYFFLKSKHQFFVHWIKSQKAIQVDAEPFWGISTQIVTFAATLFWIFN
jgi:hypothetical protein